MTPNDINRQKYAALMAEIEDLEEAIAKLEQDIAKGPGDVTNLQKDLRDAQAKLAEKRTELRRVSDGCGRPHPAC